jgi:ABC-type glycerol-3-phosphate transport system substrate-binding protein
VWKNKKVVLLAALALAVLIGGIAAGVTFAQTGTGNQTASGNETQPQARYEALLDKVAAIYQEKTGVALDVQQLEDAFAQARNEMQNDAVQSWLQKLVTRGIITQDQANQYLQWWQSRPDVPLSGPSGWGFKGHGFHGGR